MSSTDGRPDMLRHPSFQHPCAAAAAAYRKVLKYAMKSNDCWVTCITFKAAVQAFHVECAAFLRAVVFKTIPPNRLIETSQQVCCSNDTDKAPCACGWTPSVCVAHRRHRLHVRIIVAVPADVPVRRSPPALVLASTWEADCLPGIAAAVLPPVVSCEL